MGAYFDGDAQTWSGVRCELCGVVRMNAMESRDGVVRCQDSYICSQVVALVAGARSTYEDLVEAGWNPADPTPAPSVPSGCVCWDASVCPRRVLDCRPDESEDA